jgi:hypothetical protein
MKNILFELRLATIVDSVKSISVAPYNLRTEQYKNGLKARFEYYDEIKKCGVDFVFVDNTVENYELISNEIRELIPEDVIKVVQIKNQYGHKNKGAGDIEMWNNYIPLIQEYKWFFHYEPRMLLTKPDFILSFCKNPRNYFCTTTNNTQFFTGAFGLESELLIKFCLNIDLQSMVYNFVSIEDNLFKFFEDKPFDSTNKVFTIWHDAHTNKYLQV